MEGPTHLPLLIKSEFILSLKLAKIFDIFSEGYYKTISKLEKKIIKVKKGKKKKYNKKSFRKLYIAGCTR